MKKYLIAIALLAATPASADTMAPTQAVAAPTRHEPAAELKNGRYEISTDMGGYINGYNIKFRVIEATGLEVRVKDICASACTIVLSLPRACAERGALFGFHQVQRLTDKGYEYSETGTRILWSYYPEAAKGMIGRLTPDMVWIKGHLLLPPCSSSPVDVINHPSDRTHSPVDVINHPSDRTLEAEPAKAQDLTDRFGLTMLEDRFGLPVFQTGPSDKALWWTWRILTKRNEIGEAIFALPEECKKYNHLARHPETKHIWCAANVPPFCKELSKEIDGIDEITSAEVKRIDRSIVTKMGPPKGFKCLGGNMDDGLTWRPVAGAEVPAQYRGLWCVARDDTYYRCREANDEGYQHIRRDRIKLSEEGDCRIIAVTRTAKGHRLRVYCTPDVIREDPPEHVNLRLDARGRLMVDR